MISGKARSGISRFRNKIIRDAVGTFGTTSYFQGKGQPAEAIVTAVSEGLLDLLEEGEVKDPETVRLFVEWLYNLIRKESKKTDTTLEFLDGFEGLVTRYLNNEEDAEVDVFFELCRDIVQRKHELLVR